jgi:hypothetical protein
MLINKKNILTLSLIAILGLSSHAFAGKGNGNSSGAASHNGMGDMSRTRSENTLRYKKQQGAKPQYQHQYKHNHQNTHQNTRINSVQGNPVNNFSAQQSNE